MSRALITWEEAEWTREALGMSAADFARLLDVEPSAVYAGQKRPRSFLSPRAALLLTLGVNRINLKAKREALKRI